MNTDILFILAFLLLTLTIGLSTTGKITTFRDYAIGKKLPTYVITCSLVATVSQGRTLNMIAYYHRDGWWELLNALILLLAIYLGSKILLIRMAEFSGNLSVAESMGQLYGAVVRKITALSALLVLLCNLITQLRVILETVRFSLPSISPYLSYWFAIGIASVVIIYASIGGVKSVAITDVVQLLCFSLALPCLGFFLLRYPKISITEGWETVEQLPQFSSLHYVFKADSFRKYFFYTTRVLLIILAPLMIQRFYMSRSIKQAQKVFNLSLGIRFYIYLSLFLIAMTLYLSGHVLKPGENIVRYFLNAIPWKGIKILMGITVLSLLMSTVDSVLHLASVIVVNDLLPQRWFQQGHPSTREAKKIKLARFIILITGATTLYYALYYRGNIYNLMSVGSELYMTIVAIPFVMAILGFRTRKEVILITMIIAGIFGTYSVLYKPAIGNESNEARCLSMCISLFTLIIMHYLLPQLAHTGWVGIKDDAPLLVRQQNRRRKWEKWINATKTFNWNVYSKHIFPKKETLFSLVGIYANLMIFISLFITKLDAYLHFGICMMVLASCFIYYPGWNPSRVIKKGKVMHYIWLSGLFLLLFFNGSLVCIINQYNVLITLLYFIGICIGFYVLPTALALFMLLASLTLTNFIFPHPSWSLIPVAWGSWFHFLLAICSCWFAIKYIHASKTIGKKNKTLISYYHALLAYQRAETIDIKHYQQEFDRVTKGKSHEEDVLPIITDDLKKAINSDDINSKNQMILSCIDRLEGYRDFITERLHIERHHLPLHPKPIDCIKLIDQAIQYFKQAGIELDLAIYNCVNPTTITCDVDKIKILIHNVMQLIQHSNTIDPEGIVRLYIKDTQIKYRLSVSKDEYKLLPALAFFCTTSKALPMVEPIYNESLDPIPTTIITDESDLYHAEIMRIVTAHYGCLMVNQTEDHITFSFILPIALKSIRDSIMDQSPASISDIDVTASSIAQEQELEDLLTEKTTLTRDFIHATIQYVKKCHGNQKRESGEPFYTHPMEVAKILLAETKDPDTIIAALLHDVVEDSKATRSYIRSRFGSNVAEIVNRVTHMGDSFCKMKLTKKENEARIKNFKDIRSVQVKLADRLHNVRTLNYCPIEKQIKIVQQTLAFYIPFSESVGVTTFTAELKEKCQEILKQCNNHPQL